MSEVTEVITVRVSKSTKSIMNASDINWSEDIRRYIEARAKSLRLNKVLKALKPVKLNKNAIDSTILIMQDRDSR
jgi:predicted transcriptional regulator